VRRSIKAIGQAAVKIEAGAERCVNVLLDLIATRVSYVVQEAVVVMKVYSFINTLALLLTRSLRIFSADTHRHMKVSSQLYVRI
jgi:vesicle coat complex subunit